MRHAILTSFLMGLLAVTAWAQEEGEREQQRGDRPRGERRIGQERRERGPGEQRGGGRDRGPGMDRMWTRVADELDLDEEQRVQFDEISAKYRERMREAGQRWQEVREEMREAREAGDEERVRELRAEMRGGRESEGAFAEALEELEPILREDQVARLWELQDRMQGRGQDRERYRRVINDLPDELDLSDEQRDEFEQLLNSQREKMRERWSDVQPLMDEMREARQAGDEERVRELQEQLEQTRPSQEAMFEAFFVELKDMLTEEQVERLAAFRKSLSGGGPDKEGEAGSVRDVLRAVKRLKLDSKQKEGIREIEREAIRAYREIPRKDKQEHAALAREVKAEIIKVLDEDQVKEFEQQLTRPDRGRRGESDQQRERGERRDRGRRGEREP